jgi:hypothetical protein
MKNCSNHAPDCIRLQFEENPNRKNIFDLKTASRNFNRFSYFRLQKPKKSYLINQGAKFVCESWTKNTKIFHTGLIQTAIENYYFGDFAESYNGKKKSSLMIFHYLPETSTIEIYFFNQYNKKSVSMKHQFCRDYIINHLHKKRE